MITEEEKEQVRGATDLVALVQETVELRPRGHEFWGCCPFHGEKTPSFHVIPATQVWHCFGCGEGGDCFSYVMKRENLTFPEAIRYLADRAGIELHEDRAREGRSTKRARLIEVCEETSRYYHTLLMRGKDGRGRAYCQERALDSETCKRYRLGFAPGHGMLVAHLGSKGFTPREMIDANVAFSSQRGALTDRFFDRLMFPIFDDQGRCVAFGGRALDKESTNAKYLNTSETPIFHKGRLLYGFNWAKEFIVAQNEAIVVEGYISAMSCWKAGLQNIVAVLGTALTEHHVKTLTRFTKRIVYLFDGDEAGQRAARRAIQFVEQDDVDLRCVTLPDGMDPDDYVRAHGGASLRALLDTAQPLMDYVFNKLQEESDSSTPGGRARALKEACELIYPLRESYVIDSYYVQIADRLGLDADAVRASAPRVFREVDRRERETRRREEQRARARSAQDAAGVQSHAPDQALPPYDDADAFSYDEEPILTDAGPGPDDLALFTELERRQLVGERELLSLLTSYPDDFRPFADRITEVDWVDARHEAIAWAVLATPEGSTPTEVMAAARAVCPEVASLVGAGTVSSTSAHPAQTNIEFMLNTLALYTARRRMRAAQARLRSASDLTAEERRQTAIQYTRDAQLVRELERAVSDVADPFRKS